MSDYLVFPDIQQPSFPIEISYDNISLKSRKENGDYKLRKKFTYARKTFSLKWNAMSSLDYQILESFYINDCQTNVKKFLWKYPSVKTNVRTRYDIFNNQTFIVKFKSLNVKVSEYNSYIVEIVLEDSGKYNDVFYPTDLVIPIFLNQDLYIYEDGQISLYSPNVKTSSQNYYVINNSTSFYSFYNIKNYSDGYFTINTKVYEKVLERYYYFWGRERGESNKLVKADTPSLVEHYITQDVSDFPVGRFTYDDEYYYDNYIRLLDVNIIDNDTFKLYIEANEIHIYKNNEIVVSQSLQPIIQHLVSHASVPTNFSFEYVPPGNPIGLPDTYYEETKSITIDLRSIYGYIKSDNDWFVCIFCRSSGNYVRTHIVDISGFDEINKYYLCYISNSGIDIIPSDSQPCVIYNMKDLTDEDGKEVSTVSILSTQLDEFLTIFNFSHFDISSLIFSCEYSNIFVNHILNMEDGSPIFYGVYSVYPNSFNQVRKIPVQGGYFYEEHITENIPFDYYDDSTIPCFDSGENIIFGKNMQVFFNENNNTIYLILPYVKRRFYNNSDEFLFEGCFDPCSEFSCTVFDDFCLLSTNAPMSVGHMLFRNNIPYFVNGLYMFKNNTWSYYEGYCSNVKFNYISREFLNTI